MKKNKKASPADPSQTMLDSIVKGIEEKRFLTKNKLPICRKCADRNQFKCNLGEKHCHKCNKQIQMGTKYLTNRDHNKFFHSELFKIFSSARLFRERIIQKLFKIFSLLENARIHQIH